MNVRDLGQALPIRKRTAVAILNAAAADVLSLYFLLPVLSVIWMAVPHAQVAPVTIDRVLASLFATVVVVGFFQWIAYYYRVHLTLRFHDNGIAFKKRFRRQSILWNEITRCRIKNKRWAEIRSSSGRLYVYLGGFRNAKAVLNVLKNQVRQVEVATSTD